ncbi:rCG30968 [Rattus norvegicus]|uniref:RCG30968 n=1 Tax=Rattus norvegicus TaxID=10116 RepID=A6ITN8_RAT|nr:rCG30968 [Rattus norvegicus]
MTCFFISQDIIDVLFPSTVPVGAW